MRRSKEPDKLAQDAAKALAAGMSYGKWKAMQEIVVPEEVKPKVEYGVCVYCGKQYVKNNYKKRVYCDWLCRYNANRERYKLRKLAKEQMG